MEKLIEENGWGFIVCKCCGLSVIHLLAFPHSAFFVHLILAKQEKTPLLVVLSLHAPYCVSTVLVTMFQCILVKRFCSFRSFLSYIFSCQIPMFYILPFSLLQSPLGFVLNGKDRSPCCQDDGMPTLRQRVWKRIRRHAQNSRERRRALSFSLSMNHTRASVAKDC